MKNHAVQKKLQVTAANSVDYFSPGSKKRKRTSVEEIGGSAQSKMLDCRQQEVFEDIKNP